MYPATFGNVHPFLAGVFLPVVRTGDTAVGDAYPTIGIRHVERERHFQHLLMLVPGNFSRYINAGKLIVDP